MRRSLGAKDVHFHAADDGSMADFFELDGVQCQTVHEPVATFDRELERYLVELEASKELPKIVMGLFDGLPLLGEEQVERWREAAQYTDELQRAELERRWSFFPWWYVAERLNVRGRRSGATTCSSARRTRSIELARGAQPRLVLDLRVQARARVPRAARESRRRTSPTGCCRCSTATSAARSPSSSGWSPRRPSS